MGQPPASTVAKMPVRFWSTRHLICFLLAIASIASANLVDELKTQKDLTPDSFIRHFADFTYELGDQVQEPESFLERKRGDCDDFAKLASDVLTQRGYKTKVVVVMMEKETHVVCYVAEAHGFLDFNFRAAAKPIIESDGSLEDVAQKVSAYFRSKWHMASEVRYKDNRPVFVDNTFPMAVTAKSTETKKPGATKNRPKPQPVLAIIGPSKPSSTPVQSEGGK
jgi:hypothetical protein